MRSPATPQAEGASAEGPAAARSFFDRELSWLAFNERVLSLAADESLPLLERVRFVAIHASNLDEFFQVRMSGVIEAAAAGAARVSAAGYAPRDLLKAVQTAAGEQTEAAATLFEEQLRPALAHAGIEFLDAADLDCTRRAWISQRFSEQVFPVLTPLAVDPAHPFPHISDLSLNLAVFVKHGSRAPSFARVKVPPILPRFLALPDDGGFVPLESMICAHLESLFPGMDIHSASAFRVTRDAEIDLDDRAADDLSKQLEAELNLRRFGEAVRLEAAVDLADAARELLTRGLNLTPGDVCVSPSLLGFADLVEIANLDRPDLRRAPHASRIPPALKPSHAQHGNGSGGLVGGSGDDSEDGSDFFDALRRSDVLVHMPYESFTRSVGDFIRQTADDPDVLAVKMTMYRTSERTQLVDSLIRAAERGKQVVVVVELQARFDEQANLEWARQLERAGVHVAYGLVGLKTHCKLALVVRREGRRLVRYSYIGTGNFNADTARIYEDLGLFTVDEEVAADIAELFNTLTGYSLQRDFRKLAVAPHSLGPMLRERIAAEAASPDGRIVMKLNSIVDREIIEALYEASCAGCRVDLVVRGICCLVPGVPEQSENITVRSVIGRFLEHSRIYRFGNPDAGRPFEFLIGSADAMPRNLRHRVEALIPVSSPPLVAELTEVTQMYLRDDIAHWALGANGQWTCHRGEDLHELMLARHAARNA